MVRSQRDVMRDLFLRLGGDADRVVSAYAEAERRGEAPRVSNLHRVDGQAYARALYADGIKKGWLGAPATGIKATPKGTTPSPPRRAEVASVAPDAGSRSVETVGAAPMPTGVTVPLDLGGLSTPNLLQLSAGVIDELRRRQVVRTTNNPVADYSEFLAARAFGLELAGRSEAGYDAKDESGLRYQVKARRLTDANPSRQLGFIRGLEGDPFDFLLAILFNSNYTVFRAALIPVAIVRARAAWVEYVRAWRLVLTDPVFDIDGVRDITDEIRSAAAIDVLINAQGASTAV